MFKKTFLIFISSLLIFIPACKKSPADHVKSVKQGILDFDKSLKVGDAFDNYKYFSIKDWRAFETDQKRMVVEFKGNIRVDQYIDEIEKEFGKKFQLLKDSNFNSLEYVTQFAISQDDDSFKIAFCGFNVNYKDGKTNNIPDKELSGVENIYKNELDPLAVTIILSLEKELEDQVKKAAALEEKNIAKLKEEENMKKFESIKQEAIENATKLFYENISHCGDGLYYRPGGQFSIIQIKGEMSMSFDGIGEFPPQVEITELDKLNNTIPDNIEWKGIVNFHIQFARKKKGAEWQDWVEGNQLSAYLLKINGNWKLDFSYMGNYSAPNQVNCDEI